MTVVALSKSIDNLSFSFRGPQRALCQIRRHCRGYGHEGPYHKAIQVSLTHFNLCLNLPLCLALKAVFEFSYNGFVMAIKKGKQQLDIIRKMVAYADLFTFFNQ